MVDKLLTQSSRYNLNVNTVNYRGNIMYDIPYKVSNPNSGNISYNVLKASTESRLDLLAYDNYNSSSYWWVLAQINNVDNPFDVEEGTLILIPNIELVLMQSQQGGN